MDDSSTERAPQACTSCRKQKRKCDKALPICGYCLHTKRPCDYLDVEKRPSAADFAALQERIAALESRGEALPPVALSTRSSPSGSTESKYRPSPSRSDDLSSLAIEALFLDIDCYKWTGLQLPKTTIQIPAVSCVPDYEMQHYSKLICPLWQEVVSILTEGDQSVIDIALAHFSSSHFWLPIVSKKRMDLGFSVRDSGPDVAMLLLSMKLLAWQGSEPPGTNLQYRAAKSFLASLELNGDVSFLCLQAMIFVAAFEYGHAIYPAAWMTIGACSRYAEMLGLSFSKAPITSVGPVQSWTRQEEQRRTLWAIYVLDRLVCLGSRRSFSMSDPQDDAILPVDDCFWDVGDPEGALHQPASTPLSVSQSTFTRLCQAALLVSRSTHSVRLATKLNSDNLHDIGNITDEICSFLTILEPHVAHYSFQDTPQILTPCAVAWSALYMLLDRLSCPEKLEKEAGYVLSGTAKSPEQLSMQAKAMSLIKSISYKIEDVARRVITVTESSTNNHRLPVKMGPLCLDAFYCAILSFHWLHREGGNEEHRRSIAVLTTFMGLLGGQWTLATSFLKIAHHYDAFSAAS